MTTTFPRDWIRDFIDSGLVRAATSSGTTRGDGKRERTGSYGSLIVYLAILAYEDTSPSIAELMRVCGVGSKNTIKHYITSLEDLGAITVHRTQRGNSYEVLPLPDLGLPPRPVSARASADARQDKPIALRAPDGHVLRSVVELVVDILLVLHNVPHATEVPFSAIFEGFTGKHDMDFLIAPTIGIEVWGAAGPDYVERRRIKEEVATKHGFSLHGVESLEDAYRLVPGIAERLGATFGGASLDELERLLRLYRQSPAHRDTLPGVVGIKARITEVQATAGRSRQMMMEDELWRNPYGSRVKGLGQQHAKAEQFPLTSPELLDAHRRIDKAAQSARQSADVLASVLASAGQTSEHEWAPDTLRKAEQARRSLEDADTLLGGVEGILQRRVETPEQVEVRRWREAEDEKSDQEQVQALRLLKTVRAVLRGEDNPYAASDARRAKEAKRAALRRVLMDAMPELAAAAGGHLDDALDTIEAEMDGEALADIL